MMFQWLDQFEDRARRLMSIERADSRDRNTGGRSTGNKGGGGGGDRTGGGGRDNGTRDVVQASKPSPSKPSNINNSRQADDAMAEKYGVTPDRYIDATRAFRDRTMDANDTGNSAADDIGNAIARVFGLNEVAEDFDPNNLSPNAHWHWDPVKTALTVGGLANPVVSGLSAAYSLGRVAGMPPASDIDLGPSVFGRPDQAPGSVGAPSGNTTRGLTSGKTATPSRAPADRTSQMSAAPRGLIRPAPVKQAAAQIPQPENPAQTPAPAPAPSPYPTPSEKFGGSPLSWVYDPSTGQLIPKAA